MKITEIIAQLQAILTEHGDLECGSTDGSPDEGYTYEFEALQVITQVPTEDAEDQTTIKKFVNIYGGSTPLDMEDGEFLDEVQEEEYGDEEEVDWTGSWQAWAANLKPITGRYLGDQGTSV